MGAQLIGVPTRLLNWFLYSGITFVTFVPKKKKKIGALSHVRLHIETLKGRVSWGDPISFKKNSHFGPLENSINRVILAQCVYP